MINAEQYLAEIDARAKKYADGRLSRDSYLDDYMVIKRAMLDAASLVNDAWLREIGEAMEKFKPKE